ncbi:MAG: primosomal protein N' [Rickettsiaceae bacterium]|nr:primosomal protein N' [Rickettsiaceae bacterium]
MQIIKVLIPKAGLFPLDYKISNDINIEVGDLIIVPFRNKNITGVVWETNCSPSDKQLKIIDRTLNPPGSNYKNIGLANIELIKKASSYYLASLGSIAKLVVPFDIDPQLTLPESETFSGEYSLPNLSEEQTNTLNFIKATSKPMLLKGVTGSGKTEVYFYLVAETIKKGKQSLIMLPEISLSSQIIKRFTQRFGFKPALWNSSISKTRKKKIMQGILSGSTKVVIGTRSSLFLPYKSLALIVVDEEHDASYKQGEGILYNARDMAVLKAHLLAASVVLVSATPSIETIYNVQQEKYSMVELKSRFSDATLPEVEIIDMRNIELEQNNWLSKPLITAINTTLGQGNQCLLFLNRRGYAPLMLCKACGYRFQCSKCSASMVTHKSRKLMECHHCGIISKIYDTCPECHHDNSLILCGTGIERIEEEVKRLFPDSRIKVISKDQNTKTNQVQTLLHEMEIGNIDILIGTQIVTKGYHFPKLSLVGVVDADLGFLGGDLKSVEKTFQLLHQVGGRAGREQNTKGKVLLQTYFPENKALIALAQGKEKEFIEIEMLSRKEAQMPPFTKMAVINIAGKYQEKTCSIANYIVQKAPISSARILGPAEALIFKLSGRYRYRILIICERTFNIQKYISLWFGNCKIPSSFQIKIDIDPYNFY